MDKAAGRRQSERRVLALSSFSMTTDSQALLIINSVLRVERRLLRDFPTRSSPPTSAATPLSKSVE